jgi:hypothetical protein
VKPNLTPSRPGKKTTLCPKSARSFVERVIEPHAHDQTIIQPQVVNPALQHTQPAGTRRSAEVQLRGLITQFAPAHRRLVGATRRWLRQRLPTAHELVYAYRDAFVISFSPNDHGYEGVFALRADAKGVRLYLNRGKGLPDPEKVLQGSGSLTRWIHLEGAATLARPAVARLIDEALARNRVPFARAGRGAVIMRSGSDKQRRRSA